MKTKNSYQSLFPAIVKKTLCRPFGKKLIKQAKKSHKQILNFYSLMMVRNRLGTPSACWPWGMRGLK